jgi:cytochrome c oxidase subunit 2
MALQVVAEPPEQYEAWVAAQRRPAGPASTDPQLWRGRELFLSGTCVMCHAIRGTTANARRGPDLTHVGSRTELAAGALANTHENLVRWIADPQAVKPGVNMPSSTLAPDDLQSLAAYLGSLK